MRKPSFFQIEPICKEAAVNMKKHINGRNDPYNTRIGTSPIRRRKTSRSIFGLFIAVLVLVGAFILFKSFFPSLFNPTGKSTTSQQATAVSSKTTASTVVNTSSLTSAASVPSTTSGSSAATSTTAAATVSPAARAQAFAKAKTDIETLTAKYKGRYAVYYQNLVTSEQYTFKADQPFVAASSIKLGINTDLYVQIAAGKISPTEMLAYDNRPYPAGDYEAGTGSIQGQPNGTRYSVRDTSGLSIRISDNCATNMVIRKLGGIDTVNVYLREISNVVDYRKPVSYTNYAGSTVSGRHRTCATDLGKHAVNLYRLFQENPKFYQPLIDDLCKTEFDFGIQKGIPASVRVAHKIGTNGTYNTENDVGIVFAGEPFVLCIMTESSNASIAHQYQAEAARILYEYIDSVT